MVIPKRAEAFRGYVAALRDDAVSGPALPQYKSLAGMVSLGYMFSRWLPLVSKGAIDLSSVLHSRPTQLKRPNRTRVLCNQDVHTQRSCLTALNSPPSFRPSLPCLRRKSARCSRALSDRGREQDCATPATGDPLRPRPPWRR